MPAQQDDQGSPKPRDNAESAFALPHVLSHETPQAEIGPFSHLQPAGQVCSWFLLQLADDGFLQQSHTLLMPFCEKS